MTVRWILFTALAVLWGYFLVAVADRPAAPPQPVAEAGEEPSAASLNNRGVEADRQGRRGDALAYFARARDFEPGNEIIERNWQRQTNRVERDGWLRALATLTGISAGSALFFAWRRARDRRRLRRLRLRGEPALWLEPAARRAEMALQFTEPVGPILRRHPLTIVWSSAGHGKHMKSRPPARAEGPEVKVTLEGERLDRLRACPGLWRAFLYLGRTPVGEGSLHVCGR